MACFRPLLAWKLEGGEVAFKERGKVDRELRLPCGQCVGCRLDRARAWTIRCVHEAQLHEFNSFVTLTYSEQHLPSHGSLCYRDFQLFMKRLRKDVGPVRFFMCGEYGENLSRPHYHAVLFGYRPSDLVLFSSRRDQDLYTSSKLEMLWGRGFVTCGAVTSESAAYVAGYVMKKITGPMADDHYSRVTLDGEIVQLEPEFCRMSLRPGIGAGWFERFGKEVSDWDQVILNGRKLKVPRYYDDRIKAVDPDRFEALQFARTQRSASYVGDNTRDRLAVREAVATARVNLKTRKLEST